jgi:hypothetical protein
MRTTRVIAAILGFLLASCSGDDHLVFTTGTLPSTTSTTTTAPAATTTTTQPDPVALGVWRPMANSPLGARDGALAVWTGSELLVMGGRAVPPCSPLGSHCLVLRPALSDGAAFDPVANEWRPIATAPVPLVGPPSAVVLDGVVYMWAYGPPWPETTRAFLAYHPDEDRWEQLATPDGGILPFLVATGDGLVLYQESTTPPPPEVALGVSPDLVFDPKTGEWVPLPPDPLRPSYDRRMVWTGTELVLLATSEVDSSSIPRFLQAAAYDPVAGAWRRLPDSEIAGGGGGWSWIDQRIVGAHLGSTDGGVGSPYGRSYDPGGMLDPAFGVWAPLPDAPDPSTRLDALLHYTAGGEEYLLNRYGWLFAPASGRWLPIDEPPGTERSTLEARLRNRMLGRMEAVVAWAGSDLVVWGGSIAVPGEDGLVATLIADGWMLRPDPDAVVPEVLTWFPYLSPELSEVAFDFEAPDPATHSFDLRLEFPDFVDPRLRLETPDGLTLQVFQGVDAHPGSCTIEYDQVRCLLHFPALEAPRAGSWSAILTRVSPGYAPIAIELTWYPTEG